MSKTPHRELEDLIRPFREAIHARPGRWVVRRFLKSDLVPETMSSAQFDRVARELLAAKVLESRGNTHGREYAWRRQGTRVELAAAPTVREIPGLGEVVWSGGLERAGKAPSLVSDDYHQRPGSDLPAQASSRRE